MTSDTSTLLAALGVAAARVAELEQTLERMAERTRAALDRAERVEKAALVCPEREELLRLRLGLSRVLNSKCSAAARIAQIRTAVDDSETRVP